MDGAQVESDVAADRLADAAAGLGEATAALTAAEAAHKLRVERAAKLEGEEFNAALVRARGEADTQRKRATERLKVIPLSLQESAQKGYKAEVDALEAARKARDDAGKPAPTDAVEEAANRLADAEAKVRERLDSTLPDIARATALLKKVAGEKNDPPLLTKEEQESFEPESGAAAARGASRGGGSGARADPAELERIANEKARAYEETLALKKQGAQPGEDVERDPDVVHARTELMQAAQAYERALQAGGPAGQGGGASVTKAELIALGRATYDKARAYEKALAEAKKAKPGEDPEADPAVVKARTERDEARTAYEKAVKSFEPPPESRLPDKAWQALLDERQAVSILNPIPAPPEPPDLIKPLDKAVQDLAQAKANAANGRRAAEDKKYEARKAAKLYEKARAAHESRLLSAVRGDF
jgi:hypothetical protein